ncbi:MAG: beta-ketoacyl-[acyl-carrier-protein] synthase II, partial [Eubacteriales bacterium]
IAAVLALTNDTIPPTVNLLSPDPECDLDYTPNTAKETPVNLALSTSLGFGGHNACLAFAKIKD